MQLGHARRCARRRLFQFLDIRTRDKRPPAADDHHDLDGRIISRRLDLRLDPFRHPRTERVHRGIVDRNHGHAVVLRQTRKFAHKFRQEFTIAWDGKAPSRPPSVEPQHPHRVFLQDQRAHFVPYRDFFEVGQPAVRSDQRVVGAEEYLLLE